MGLFSWPSCLCFAEISWVFCLSFACELLRVCASLAATFGGCVAGSTHVLTGTGVSRLTAYSWPDTSRMSTVAQSSTWTFACLNGSAARGFMSSRGMACSSQMGAGASKAAVVLIKVIPAGAAEKTADTYLVQRMLGTTAVATAAFSETQRRFTTRGASS